MRVAVYARVSTEHEAQINALGNQLEWYKIEGSRHSDWEIVEVYVDQGITGTQAQKRPEFLHMIEDAKKGDPGTAENGAHDPSQMRIAEIHGIGLIQASDNNGT